MTEWQKKYWQDLSVLDGLRPVLDPKDAGHQKNNSINELHANALNKAFSFLGKRFSSALDYGCGVGRNFDLIKKYADQYTGVDLTQGMIDRFSGVLKSSDRVLLTDGKSLAFDGDSFDLIVSFWVLQHVVEDRDLSHLIKEFHRVLVKDGAVVICERSDRVKQEKGQEVDYINKRSPKEYIKLFEDSGFKLKYIRKAPYRKKWKDLFFKVLQQGDNIYVFSKK